MMDRTDETRHKTGKVLYGPQAMALPIEAAPPAQVLDALGAGAAPESVKRATTQVIESANAEIAAGLIRPQLVADELAIDGISPDGITVRGSTLIPCNGGIFEGADRIIIAIATLGPRLQEKVKAAFAANEPLFALIMDVAGTILIRNASITFQADCAARAQAIGLETGPRISPGCRFIPLEAQRALFSLLDADSIGVTLTDSLLMTPVKSVSILFPLGPALPHRLRTFSMCRICPHSAKCMQIIL